MVSICLATKQKGIITPTKTLKQNQTKNLFNAFFATIPHNIEYMKFARVLLTVSFTCNEFSVLGCLLPYYRHHLSHTLQTKYHSSRFTANIIIAFLDAIFLLLIFPSLRSILLHICFLVSIINLVVLFLKCIPYIKLPTFFILSETLIQHVSGLFLFEIHLTFEMLL